MLSIFCDMTVDDIWINCIFKRENKRKAIKSFIRLWDGYLRGFLAVLTSKKNWKGSYFLMIFLVVVKLFITQEKLCQKLVCLQCGDFSLWLIQRDIFFKFCPTSIYYIIKGVWAFIKCIRYFIFFWLFLNDQRVYFSITGFSKKIGWFQLFVLS